MVLDYKDTDLLDETTLAVLNSLPFGVYYCDTSLTVLYINQPYADYLGFRPQDIVGRKVTDFIPNTRAMAVIESGHEELYDVMSTLNKKMHQRILVNRIPVRNDQGQVVGFISQLMSVGCKGWSDVWQKIEYAEKMMHLITPAAASTDPAKIEGDIRKSIIGESPLIQEALTNCFAFGRTEEAVLITGGTGVGKELFANAVHRCSRRATGPLVSINCACMSKEFIASELFGYAPGAFTGAAQQGKPGQIELAHKGTLFLDEIGDLPLQAQGMLLRVLETQQVQRINATNSRYVDFRLISATNHDLKKLLECGQFRNDLYYRINNLPLSLPQLSERAEDIPILTRHLLKRFGAREVRVHPEAMMLLQNYSWPGNVRELRNVLTYAAVHANYQTIKPEHLPGEVLKEGSMGFPHRGDNGPAGPSPEPSPTSLADRERDAIIKAMHQVNGNLTQTARLLDISRSTLYQKIKKYNIPR